jgi:hypothetical protein
MRCASCPRRVYNPILDELERLGIRCEERIETA